MGFNKTFKHVDGSLLTTLIISGRKSTLKDIVLIFNTINHNVIQLEEVNEGLSRLESEGFVGCKNGKIFTTQKTKNFHKKNKKKLELCIDMNQRYSNILKTMVLEKETQYKQYFSMDEYKKVVNDLFWGI